jgi:hypothetical protein
MVVVCCGFYLFTNEKFGSKALYGGRKYVTEFGGT